MTRLLFALALCLSGCSTASQYEKTVASRSVSAGGQYGPQGGSGKVVYSVTYR